MQEGVHGNNDLRGAILVFMAGSRNDKMVKAAQKVGFIERLNGGVGEKVYLFLWTRMHEDMLWLAEQSDAWKKTIAHGLPWKTMLTPRFYNSKWDASTASLLSVWEPTRLHKFPKALKYMVNPSEKHILAAACGQDGGYMNAEQIDAIRPGASTWFKTRKMLNMVETREEATRAFRQWVRQGAVQEIEHIDAEMFSTVL